jgi:hypothetical protein
MLSILRLIFGIVIANIITDTNDYDEDPKGKLRATGGHKATCTELVEG